MLFAAHQPHYLPWLRYLHKVAAADVFVLLDDAQYTKNGWQNRTRIGGAQGPVLLTVPVHSRLGERIFEVRPADDRWPGRHLVALDSCYGSGFRPWRAALAGALDGAGDRSLAELNEATLRLLLSLFGIETPVIRSSALGVPGRASERLAAIGSALGADAYLTGAYALETYLDPAPFAAAGIEIAVQRWECPRYRQRFPGSGFLPDLSALDLLLNEGGRAREVLLAGGEVTPGPTFAADARS
jgi:hypothetical protein